ncbi:hypothetical protein AAG906_021716 [Vitis piasezkii]
MFHVSKSKLVLDNLSFKYWCNYNDPDFFVADAFIGVNIGTDLSDMPHPTQVVALLKAQQIRHVRLFNAEPAMLIALANTGIRVTVAIPNEQVLGVGQSNSTAANWVSRNIVAHYPATNITTIAVGSEVLTTLPNAAPVLVNALKFIHSALLASNLDRQIKVSTPFLPLSSLIHFHLPKPSSTDHGIQLCLFLLTRKLLMLTHLHYSNVFDAMVDAAYFAMAYLNFTNIPVMVTESGWPSKGGSNEPDATVDNANTYNSNLIRHVLNKTERPNTPELLKELGLFDANGTPIYILHLTGSGLVLANDTLNQTYCTAKDGADEKMLQAALDWACGPGKVDCSPLLQGKDCYEPDNVAAHATFAFDTYYHKMGKAPGTCDFNGVAAITTTDPSKTELESMGKLLSYLCSSASTSSHFKISILGSGHVSCTFSLL